MRACPICGSSQARTIYEQSKDPITRDRFEVVQCLSCQMVYTGDVPAPLERYYPARYRSYGPRVTRILASLYGLRVSRWARFKRRGGFVLEIGCGPGLMLAAFKRRGWRVLGIERNETAAEIGRRSLGIDITSVPVEALPPGAQFDLVVLFQVLEHIPDPVGLLSECAKRLAPGGRVVVNVPNFASWQSKFARASWFHLDVPRHLNHFTPATLERAFQRAGLQLHQMGFASLEHDPYGWVESALNRAFGRFNILTRFLMGIDSMGPAVLGAFALGALLSPVALMLSLFSWLAGRGALMEGIAISALSPATSSSDATSKSEPAAVAVS